MPTAPPPLRESLARHTVIHVAMAAGLSASHRGISPCPACGATHRAPDDSRPAVAVGALLTSWHCTACTRQGDALALLLALPGVTPDTAEERARELRLLSPPPRPPRAAGADPGPVRPLMPRAAWAPADEVDAVLRACAPAALDEEVAAWVVAHGGDPLRAGVLAYPDTRDLKAWLHERAGKMYGDAQLTEAQRDHVRRVGGAPAWASLTAKLWWSHGWRAIVPLRAASGHCVGLRAAWVGAGAPPQKSPAEVLPAGAAIAGAVATCPRAAVLLADGLPGDPGALVVRVVHGLARWVETCAARPLDVTLGAWGGAFDRTLADRLPAGCTVIVEEPLGEQVAVALAAAGWAGTLHRVGVEA